MAAIKNTKIDKLNSPDDVYDLERLEDASLEEKEERDYFQDETDAKILEKFKKNQATMDAHWNDIYAKCSEDWDIYNLEQWTEDGKRKRGKRPRMTMDICRKFVKTVVAETFRNPPGVKLSARSQKSSIKAQAISDAVRYFEDRTGAIYAYSFGKECAAVAGIGWLKVTYRYDDQQAMPAVIDIDRVDDPLSIKIDPDSRELDGSDAMYALEEHGKQDGDMKYTYWWKDSEGIVKWAVICGKKVEDKGVFPASDIPLIPVYGEVSRIKGKTKLFGLIRQLADVQRSYNYTVSEGMERLALTPKSPIKAAEGSISDKYLPDWLRSMTEPVGVLFYRQKDEHDSDVVYNPPSRENTDPDTAWLPSMVQMLQQSAKETVGIYDTALGEQSSETSGVAIKARIESGDRGHLVYDEHLQISIKQVGRIMLSLLDPVVTPAGILPLLAEDGTTSTIAVGMDPMAAMQGTPQLPDLDVTDLEISVSAAPAYATRKQAGLDNVTELLKILPPEQVTKLIPSIVRDMDFPGSDQYANLLDPAAGQQDPVALAQQLQGLQDQLNTVTQALTDAQNNNMQLSMQLNSNTQAMLAKANIDAKVRLTMNQNDNQTKMAIAGMNNLASEESDNKDLYIEEQKIQQQANQNMLDLSQKAADSNAKIASDAAKMKLDMLNNQQMPLNPMEM